MQDKQNGNPEIEIIFQQFFFWPFFDIFLCLNITNIQGPPEISSVSQPVWPILQKVADHLWTGAGDFPDVNNWRSNFTYNACKTDKARLLQPESKRPLKSRIGRLYSEVKTEHTFATVRTLCPGSVPAAQRHDKKSRKRLYIIIVPPYRRPVNYEYWLTKAHKKRLANPTMVKTSKNARKTKSGEKSKSTTAFPGKRKLSCQGTRLVDRFHKPDPLPRPWTWRRTGYRKSSRKRAVFSLL